MAHGHFRNVALVFLAASLALGCGLLKKKDKQDEGSSSSSGSSGDKGTSTTSDDSTEPPLDKPFKGCKMPSGNITADWTVTKGCKTKAKASFYVNEGATLTVEAGVKVEFDTDVFVWVTYGKLIVAGTEKEPVVFTSANKSPAPGDYVGIGFQEKTSAGTSIDHLQMEYAGSKASSGEGAIKLESMRQSGRISITSTKVTKSAQYAIVTDDNGGFGRFENNTFADNQSGSMSVTPETLSSVGRGNKFGSDIHVKAGNVTQTGSWPAADVAFVLDGTVVVGGDRAVTLTLPDKALVKVAQNSYIQVGAQPGALVARGVTFTSASGSPNEGDWVGVFIDGKASGTVFDGCTFEYFGANTSSGEGAITFEGVNAKDATGVTIKGNTFRKGKQSAMSSNDNKCAPFDTQGNKAEGVPLCKAD